MSPKRKLISAQNRKGGKHSNILEGIYVVRRAWCKEHGHWETRNGDNRKCNRVGAPYKAKIDRGFETAAV